MSDNHENVAASLVATNTTDRRKKRRKPFMLLLTWSVSLAALGLIALTVSYTQAKVAESQAHLSSAGSGQVAPDRADAADTTNAGHLSVAAPRVTVLPVKPGRYRPTIQAFGEVKAQTTLTLSSESTGRVEWIAPEFTVGGRVKSGDTLLRVSPRHYLTAKANAEQEQANARRETVLAQQELSQAYQEMAAAEQDALSAKQGIPNAYHANASADYGIANAAQGMANAKQGIASANQGVASAREAMANAERELSASYHDIASAEQALKEELNRVHTVNQPWSGQDAVAKAQQEVNNALLAVKQEKAQARLAQEEWKLAGQKGRPGELASRQPQLAAANARFQAAKLALQKAQYELKQQGNELGQRKPQIKSAQARLNAAKTRLQAAKARLATAKQQAVTAKTQVVTARQQAISAEKQSIVAKAQANASRGNINIAQAQIKTARARMNSAKAKVKSAKSRIASAQVRMKTAQVALDKAEYDLSSTIIRAPFDAIIGNKTVAVGSYVNVGANLGELRASNVAEITLALSMQQVSQLALDEDSVAELRSDAYPGVVWLGKVDRIADYIEPQTRTRAIVVRVDQPLEQAVPLLSGSFVSATLAGKERSDLLKIPASALAAGGFLWFVDSNNTLQRIAQSVVFSRDDVLFVEAPETTDALHIVRWPLAGYLPGMTVTPVVADDEEPEQAGGDKS